MFGTAEVPSQAIEQVTILSGGIPAEYGDLTGGVIIISTKNFISGMRESRLMREAILEPKKE
jgi:outer membrane receptor protein involved in Fe transport